MFQNISGSVEVQTATAQATSVERATERLINTITVLIPHAVIESSCPIRYKRPILQNGFIGIASLGSGELDISSTGSTLLIRYSLGLAPYYNQAFWSIVCTFFLVERDFLSVIHGAFVLAIGVVIIVGRLIYSVLTLKAWFRTTVSAAVH